VTDLDRIKDQFHRVFAGPAWHGAAVIETLAGLTLAEVQARPIPGAHTIGELLRHLLAWRTLVLHRLKGDDAYRVTHGLDWTPGPASEGEWMEDLENLRSTQRELLVLIGRFNPRLLDDQAPGSDVTWHTLFHGVLQHDLYHLGQIGLLKKALRN
jgi:uncharacterized damage-inducible protein DinB